MSPGHRLASAVLLLLITWRQSKALSMLVTFVRNTSPYRCCKSISTIAKVAGSSIPNLLSPPLPGAKATVGNRRGRLVSTMVKTSEHVPSLEDRTQEFISEGVPHSTQGLPPDRPIPPSSMLARVVPAEEPWLSKAAERLRAGKLVAFPTETVYGLGANALSEEAVLKIFKAKQRPLTDPLIVHVPDATSALTVVDLEGEGGGGKRARRLLALLGEKLWPGPLTIILKAATGVPACVTAGTGFVGVRCPDHAVTRHILSLAGVPVAAPSANRFGHVSPTRAGHVVEDLGSSDILVLDGDEKGACGVGIESTVAKIDVANDRIVVLRMGGVTQSRLQEVLAEGGEEFAAIRVQAGSVAGGKVVATEAKTKAEADGGQGEAGSALEGEDKRDEAEGQAPGQLLRHYSPDLEVFRVVGWKTIDVGAGSDIEQFAKLAETARTSVVIDFAGRLKSLECVALAYSDLSTKGDVSEAAEGLFRALRWAEAQARAQRLLIGEIPLQGESSGDLAAAVNDRIYRAASGKSISLD